MTARIDHVEQTTSSIPDGRRGQAAIDYMAVYAEGLNLLEGEAQDLDYHLNNWHRPGIDTPAWLLDAIGLQLGFPRPDGAEDRELYRRLLNLQVIARTAGGRRERVRELFDAIAEPGGAANVSFPGLNHIVVSLINAEPLQFLPGIEAVINAAIGEVDSIEIFATTDAAFTFGNIDLGFDNGLLA